MAPSAFSPGLNPAVEDVAASQTTPILYALAGSMGGILVLGVGVYLCSVLVWRYRSRRMSSASSAAEEQTSVGVSERASGLRSLVLPKKVAMQNGVPRRMILSPLYTVSTDSVKEEEQTTDICSLYSQSLDIDVESSGSSSQPSTNSAATPHPRIAFHYNRSRPHQRDHSSSTCTLSSSPSLSLSINEPTNELIPTSVHILPSSSSDDVPEIVIEDYTPPFDVDELSVSSSHSSVYSDSDSDVTVRVDYLRVPPMSWNAPRELVDAPPRPAPVEHIASPTALSELCDRPDVESSTKEAEQDETSVSEAKPLKKSRSLSKLAAVLGEVKNVARRRPSLPYMIPKQSSPAKDAADSKSDCMDPVKSRNEPRKTLTLKKSLGKLKKGKKTKTSGAEDKENATFAI